MALRGLPNALQAARAELTVSLVTLCEIVFGALDTHLAAAIVRILGGPPSASQLHAAADRVPFVGSGLPPLVLRRFACQSGRHVKARGG